MNCIIVGNGPSVLKKENGALIDSFDKVVRINNFKTLGFEKYTGTKTDILFTCELLQYNSVEKLNAFQEVIVSLLNDISLISEEVLEHKNIVKRLYWDFTFNIEQAMEMEHLTDQYPSTGIIAIYYFLEILKYNVTITGFDNFEGAEQLTILNWIAKTSPTATMEKKKKHISKNLLNKIKYKYYDHIFKIRQTWPTRKPTLPNCCNNRHGIKI